MGLPGRILQYDSDARAVCNQLSIFAGGARLRIRGNAKEWARVVGAASPLIRELDDEFFLSAIHRFTSCPCASCAGCWLEY